MRKHNTNYKTLDFNKNFLLEHKHFTLTQINTLSLVDNIFP